MEPKDMTLEEAEEFRSKVQATADALDDLKTEERIMYAALIVTCIISYVFDASRVLDLGYYLLKFILLSAVVLCSALSYKAYLNRTCMQEEYWKLVLGDQYNDKS
tara:strand:- start:1670 stop:1984 length:315 start_codon:yes stop_codon:yes gene_type:complete